MEPGQFDDITRRLAFGATRRRMVKLLSGGVAAGALSRLRGTSAIAADKVGICHLTGSASNPVVFISVSTNAIPAHEAHGDVINPDFENDSANCGGCLISCDDGDPCTIDTCEGGLCVNTPVDCSDFDDQCNVGVCVGGFCEAEPANEGLACDDGNACTQTDTCVSGECIGSDPVICTPLDQCHVAGVCDTATGACSNPNAPDGTACDDGDNCTEDECVNGACVGTLPECPPNQEVDPVTCLCVCEDVSLCAAGFDDDCNCLCTQLVCETNVETCGANDECACGVSVEGVHFCGPTPCGDSCTTTADCPAGFFCEAEGSCCGRQTCVGPCGSGFAGLTIDEGAPTRTRTGK